MSFQLFYQIFSGVPNLVAFFAPYFCPLSFLLVIFLFECLNFHESREYQVNPLHKNKLLPYRNISDYIYMIIYIYIVGRNPFQIII